MEFKVGDFVRYNYPESIHPEAGWIEGQIDVITDDHIRIRSGSILLKVSFKNFDNLEFTGDKKVYEEQ